MNCQSHEFKIYLFRYSFIDLIYDKFSDLFTMNLKNAIIWIKLTIVETFFYDFTLKSNNNGNSLLPHNARSFKIYICYTICGMKVLHMCYSVVFAPVVSSLHAKLISASHFFSPISCFFAFSRFCVAVKFIYSEKATKFCKIFTLLLSVCTVDKSKVKILQNFLAFSEYMNFNCVSFLYILGCMTFVHQKKAAGIH